MKELVKRVSEIQEKLKAPKSQRNTFGNYNYRNQEDILEAVKPLLKGLVLTVSDEIICVNDGQGNSRFYVKATATISDGEHSVSNSASAREPEVKKGMDEAQITGATSSYARKYALNGLFLIDDTKDADSMDNSSSTETKGKGFSRKAKDTPAPEEKPTEPESSEPAPETTDVPRGRSFRRPTRG